MPTLTKKRTGDTAQTSITLANVAITGSTTTGSASVTGLSSTAGFAPGASISGTGIPANSFVGTLTEATTGGSPTPGSLTLVSSSGAAANATATGSAIALTISGEVQVIGLQDWSISWKAKSVDSTTTDDASYESSLPSSASWTVKAKYIYLMGDPSQAKLVRSILQNPQTSTQTWNFFPTDRQGDDAFTGQAYIDGIDIDGAGVGKILGMGTSLKGSGPLAITPGLAPVTNSNTTTGLQAED